MGLLYIAIMSHNRMKVKKHSIGQSTLYTTFDTLLCLVCFSFVTVMSFISFEVLFLLFVFPLFVCTISFLGNVLFLGNMRRFGKLLSNSSTTSISDEEAESAIKKGL